MKRTEVPPHSPEIESLLAYERDFVARPDDLRARALVRAALLRRPALSPVQGVRRWRSAGAAAAAGIVLAMAVVGTAALRTRKSVAPFRHVRSLAEAPVELRQSVLADSPDPASVDPALTVPVEHEKASQVKIAPRGALGSREYTAELRLLQRAREAVVRGDFAVALALIAEHERRFPAGRLVEEREVLRIRSLSEVGRTAEARRAAGAFQAHFPRSVLLPRVSEMLRPVE